jgi:hypothetical protein
LDKTIQNSFLKKNELKIWGSESAIKEYESIKYSEEESKKMEKYKFSLEFISLTNDEIEIINMLFADSKEIQINKIIEADGKEYIIEPSTKFTFKYIWCYNDPYAYYIKRVIFSKENTSALLRYGWRGAFLDGRGFIAYFTKKNNAWIKTNEELEWLS